MKKDKSDNQLKSERIIPLTISVKRSKVGLSYIDVPTYAMQGVGIDNDAELKDIAKKKHLITLAGSWWKEVDPETGEVGDTIGQGLEAIRTWCSFNKDLILNDKTDGDSQTDKEQVTEGSDN